MGRDRERTSSQLVELTSVHGVHDRGIIFQFLQKVMSLSYRVITRVLTAGYPPWTRHSGKTLPTRTCCTSDRTLRRSVDIRKK